MVAADHHRTPTCTADEALAELKMANLRWMNAAAGTQQATAHAGA